jgi:hypothetical protein
MLLSPISHLLTAITASRTAGQAQGPAVLPPKPSYTELPTDPPTRNHPLSKIIPTQRTSLRSPPHLTTHAATRPNLLSDPPKTSGTTRTPGRLLPPPPRPPPRSRARRTWSPSTPCWSCWMTTLPASSRSNTPLPLSLLLPHSRATTAALPPIIYQQTHRILHNIHHHRHHNRHHQHHYINRPTEVLYSILSSRLTCIHMQTHLIHSLHLLFSSGSSSSALPSFERSAETSSSSSFSSKRQDSDASPSVNSSTYNYSSGGGGGSGGGSGSGSGGGGISDNSFDSLLSDINSSLPPVSPSTSKQPPLPLPRAQSGASSAALLQPPAQNTATAAAKGGRYFPSAS